MAEPAEHPRPLLYIVGGGAGIAVPELAFEGPIDEDREFASRGGDGLRFTDPRGQTTIKGAERGLRTTHAHRCQAQDGGGAIRGGLCPRAEKAAAGDLVVGREGEPGREVFFRGPATHVGTNLGDQLEGRIRLNPVDLGDVDATGEVRYVNPYRIPVPGETIRVASPAPELSAAYLTSAAVR